jgi:hypothetical protein
VPVTTATDAHTVDLVAERGDDVRALLVDAGYDALQGYTARAPRRVELS